MLRAIEAIGNGIGEAATTPNLPFRTRQFKVANKAVAGCKQGSIIASIASLGPWRQLGKPLVVVADGAPGYGKQNVEKVILTFVVLPLASLTVTVVFVAAASNGLFALVGVTVKVDGELGCTLAFAELAIVAVKEPA